MASILKRAGAQNLRTPTPSKPSVLDVDEVVGGQPAEGQERERPANVERAQVSWEEPRGFVDLPNLGLRVGAARV